MTAINPTKAEEPCVVYPWVSTLDILNVLYCRLKKKIPKQIYRHLVITIKYKLNRIPRIIIWII